MVSEVYYLLTMLTILINLSCRSSCGSECEEELKEVRKRSRDLLTHYNDDRRLIDMRELLRE